MTHKFTPTHNAVHLRHAVAAMVEFQGGSRKVDLTNFPEEKLAYFMQAIEEVGSDPEFIKPCYTIDQWFERHWRLFPFSDLWASLTPIQKEMVSCARHSCASLATHYGHEV
jgi:hypothetical protein